MKHRLFLHRALASKSQFDDIRSTLFASNSKYVFNYSGQGENILYLICNTTIKVLLRK